jgi:predicted nicotinamide N-methyase
LDPRDSATLPPLSERFDLVTDAIEVAGHQFEMLKPRSVDDLISEEDFDIDERLPYWAEVWPSSRVLAGHVAGLPGKGRRFLELGCGVGFASLVAARVGFQVLATDYYAEALEFVRENARRNSLPEPDVRLVDWRKFPDDLGLFDIVVGSDILYERPYTPLIVQAFKRTLAPGGSGFVTDPNRLAANGFPTECQQQGLNIVRRLDVPYQQGDVRQTIHLYELRRQEERS